ncbi:MAG: hypothetical protein K2M48_04100, partial [Clostridiales bacterium]|nr:hypothetical protein [Clostridiales bacterium]
MKTSTKVLIVVISVILIGVIIGVIVYATTGLDEKSYSYVYNDIDNIAEVYYENDTVYVRHLKDKDWTYKAYIHTDEQSALSEKIEQVNAGRDEKNQIELWHNTRDAADFTDYI